MAIFFINIIFRYLSKKKEAITVMTKYKIKKRLRIRRMVAVDLEPPEAMDFDV